MPRAIANNEITHEPHDGSVMASHRSSLGDVETEVVILSSELIAALRQIAPKPRRAKLPYVIGLALLTVGVVLGRSGLTRQFIASLSHRGQSIALAPVGVAVAPSPVAASERVDSGTAAPQLAASSGLSTATETSVGAKKLRRRKDPRLSNPVRR